jgi:hypothetical protein
MTQVRVLATIISNMGGGDGNPTIRSKSKGVKGCDGLRERTSGNYIVAYIVEILDQISDAVAHIGLHVFGLYAYGKTLII